MGRSRASRARSGHPGTRRAVKLLNELSEDDRAVAWAEISRTLEPFVGPEGFAAPSESVLIVGVA